MAKPAAKGAKAAPKVNPRWLIAGGVLFVVLLLAGVFFVTFAGGPKSSPSGDKVAPETADRLAWDDLNAELENYNASLGDPKLPAKDKKQLQANKDALEKRKKEIQAKHPDWK